MHVLTTLVLCLSVCSGVVAQFYGPLFGRAHPIHSRRSQDLNGMLAFASLMGAEIPDILMWNALAGGGFMTRPAPGPPRPQNIQRTLSMLGLLDGPDYPDPQGRRQGGKGGQGGQGEEAGQGAAGGARGGKRSNKNRNKRRKGRRGAAG